MTQLSRPFQIALVAMGMFVLVWFVALRGHGASSSSNPVAGAPVRTPASTTVIRSKQAGAPGSRTVTISKSTTKSTTVTSPKHAAARTRTTITVSKSAAPAHHAGTARSSAIPPRQAAVESELKRGEVVVVLFWNPRGADDDAVHTALQTLLVAHHEIRAIGHQQQVH